MRKRGKKGQIRHRLHTGRVQKNRRGFAFLIPIEGDGKDVYVSPKDAAPLMNHDIVQYRVERRGRREAGIIEKIVERGQKCLVGQLVFAHQNLVFRTDEGEVFVPEKVDRPRPGTWATADIVEYPSERKPGTVRMRELLGQELLPAHDLKIAVARFSLPSIFSSEVIRETESLAASWSEAIVHPSRRDLRNLPFVTIDGPTAMDFDDAILVERHKDGGFVLYVAIADVSYFVRPGTSVDRAALQRSTSVYFPGTCIPMLPEALSNDACSLRPQVDRLALTAEMHFDRSGVMGKTVFYESTIKTAGRLTYGEVQDFFDRKSDKLKHLAGPLGEARELYHLLLQHRKRRGVLDFELPECEITVDAEGKPTAMRPANRQDSHRLIEEFMIAANSAVAKKLRESKILTLYRVHEAPEPEALVEVQEWLQRLGVRADIKVMSPRALSALLDATKAHPSAKVLHQAILRLQKQAKYVPTPLGHFGLALKDYTHFTSPIRRYPDLAVHRSLKRLIGKSKNSDTKGEGESHFEALGGETSNKERRAIEAERFVLKRKQCWYMKDRLGESFQGRITGIIREGVFIEIMDLACEGFVPAGDLDGTYEFDEDRMCLRKRPGHSTLTIGDSLHVSLIQVSVDDGEITFREEPRE